MQPYASEVVTARFDPGFIERDQFVDDATTERDHGTPGYRSSFPVGLVDALTVAWD